MKRIGSRVDGVIARDRELFLSTTHDNSRFVAERGDGDFAYDIDGKRYIDFSTFISVYNFGVNANREIREAMKDQMDTLMHAAFSDYYAELPIKFAEALLRLMPRDFGRIFLSNSGAEANEAAIKFANIFTRRHYSFAFYGSFHGRTKGALGLTASRALQRAHFGPFPNTVHAPFANCYHCPFKLEHPSCGFACVEYIKEYPLGKEVAPNEVSAIFVEPIQGEGGYIVPPKDYFKQLRKLADQHGILLISDEVQAGCMRTGKFLGMDNFGVTADMYTMAKAIGGGLPMGVTAARKSLGDIKEGEHANTFGGNLVAVAGGLAVLKYILRNRTRLEQGVRQRGRYVRKRMEELKSDHQLVGDVRGIGMMNALELVRSREGKEPARKERAAIIDECFRNGLLLLPAGESSIRIIPPLMIAHENLEKGMDILESAVKKTSKG